MYQLRNVKNKKGFVIILPVILLGMAVFSAAIYFSWLAVFSLKSEISYRKSNQARYLADTCSEVALQQIWNSSSYSGSGNFSGFDGSCTYAVSNLGGENRQINATGTVGNTTRKVKILVNSVSSNVGVSSWREVADF